jgi:hypothetical protein
MRAKASGIQLDASDAAVIKAMLNRGDRQHDIAAWFGVNGGRIGEIARGYSFSNVQPSSGLLPPPGPYLSGKESAVVLDALQAAKAALNDAEALLKQTAT